MKQLNYFMLVFLMVISFACGGSKTDKAEESTQKDSNQTTEKETLKAEETEKLKEQATDKEQVTIGTFVGIEQGDYAHFNFKTESGEEKSLFVLKPDDTYEKIEKDPKKYEGVKIKVTWAAKKQNIPENGGETDIEEYIKAEILK